ELPRDPRDPEHKQYDYFDFSRRMKRLAGKSVTIRIQRHQSDRILTQDIDVQPAFHPIFGMRMRMGPITALRDKSNAASQLQEGDIIEKVEITDAQGKKVSYA